MPVADLVGVGRVTLALTLRERDAATVADGDAVPVLCGVTLRLGGEMDLVCVGLWVRLGLYVHEMERGEAVGV